MSANMPRNRNNRSRVDGNRVGRTGIAVKEVAALLNDLERIGANSAGEVPGVCARAIAVIEKLLSGLDVEQLS